MDDWQWVVLMVVGGVLALYRWQRALLYYPRAEPRLEPTLEQCVSHCFIATDDGERLEAYWAVPPAWPGDDEGARASVLFFCGNAGNITHRLPNLENLIVAARCNVLLVSYRGYGLSTGAPSEQGLTNDALAAAAWLLDPARRRHVDPDRVFVFGRSLGGAVAISLAVHEQWRQRVRGLILENTFTSIPDMIDVVFPFFRPLKSLCKDRWPSLDRIGSVQCALLVLSAGQDELVPPAHCEKLFDAAQQARFRRLVKFSQGEHMNLCTLPSYYQHIREFLDNPEPFSD